VTTPTNVCQLALSEVGSRYTITSANGSDTSPAGQFAFLNYTPRVQAIMRAVKWNCLRGQVVLTLYKAAVINGVTTSNPPIQPWLFEYLLPPDCLMARFLLPTIPAQPQGVPLTTAPNSLALIPPAPTGIPFVVATDFDAQGNPIKVLYTNLCAASLVYTRDLSQTPDAWDVLLLNSITSYLGCYAINALARNAQQYAQQVAQTKGLLDEARVINGDESISSVDRSAEWITARMTNGFGGWGLGPYSGAGYGAGGGWGGLAFPDGSSGLRY
jgi:hypothetical protein